MKIIKRIMKKTRSSRSIKEDPRACFAKELSSPLFSIDESGDTDSMEPDIPTHKKFVKENGSVYPYNEVFKTKKGFHVKWLLSDEEHCDQLTLTKHGRRASKIAPIHRSVFDDSIVIHDDGGFGLHDDHAPAKILMVHTKTLDDDTVQELILTRQAYPVPPPMERVLDAMRKYKTNEDRMWYKQVLNYFYSCLKFEVKYEDAKLTKDSVEYRVRDVLCEELGSKPSNGVLERLMEDWRLWFDLQYQVNDDYIYLAEESIKYVTSESFMST